MSQAFRAAQVVRCPLCHSGATPAHVGYSVFLCEACGNRFKVIHANPGRTGQRLSERIKERAEFVGGRNRGRS